MTLHSLSPSLVRHTLVLCGSKKVRIGVISLLPEFLILPVNYKVSVCGRWHLTPHEFPFQTKTTSTICVNFEG